MKPSDFHHLSNEEFNKLTPKGQYEKEIYEAEQAFREWCADDDLDPTHEDVRESFEEEQAEIRAEIDGFWDNLDEDEREGWESMMTD